MKLIVSSFDDQVWVPVIRRICDERGWSVCDWLVSHGSADPAISPGRAFPGAHVHFPERSSRGMLPEGLSATMPPLDGEILARMAPYQPNFDALLSYYDPDGRSFTAEERRDAYHDLLRFGLYLIRKHQPGLYIACTVPHSLQDYILYACCRAFNIPTLVYVALPIPGYQVLHSSLEEGSGRLREAYRRNLEIHSDTDITLPQDLENHFRTVRSDYSAGEPWYVKLRDHSLVTNKLSLRSLLPNPFDRANYFRKFLSRLKARSLWTAAFLASPRKRYHDYFVKPMPDFLKCAGVPLRDSVSTQYSTDRMYAKGRAVKRRLLRRYLRLERAPDFSRPFVFVPLHYQPEVSTSPLGGKFHDQLLMLQMLARHLPSGWSIYVKEHKSIFDQFTRGHFCRSTDYYERIAALPNVHLAPMGISSFDYIDRSRAVATVTGTAGCEGLLRGKPTIVFGNAWYRDCEGALDGGSESSCAIAFEKILAGHAPGPRGIRLFLKTLVEVGVRADRDRTYVLTGLSAKQSEDELFRHFLRECPATIGASAIHAKALPRGR